MTISRQDWHMSKLISEGMTLAFLAAAGCGTAPIADIDKDGLCIESMATKDCQEDCAPNDPDPQTSGMDLYFPDRDGDGFAATDGPLDEARPSCAPIEGFSRSRTDPDDGDASIIPTAQ